MVVESGEVAEDWKTGAFDPLCKGKGEITEWKNYRGISLLNVVGKPYGGALVDRVTQGLTNDQ